MANPMVMCNCMMTSRTPRTVLPARRGTLAAWEVVHYERFSSYYYYYYYY